MSTDKLPQPPRQLFIVLSVDSLRVDLSLSLICPLQAVLTRLCGCDKLLQSLSVELAQLQMDKVSNHPTSSADGCVKTNLPVTN